MTKPAGSASMDARITEHNNHATLEVDWNFTVGKGVCTNVESALIRPFRGILYGTSLVGRIAYVFYQDAREYYVLGTLAKTPNKILFFPSGDLGKMLTDLQGKSLGGTYHIDHFTLEEPYNKWHITLKEKSSLGVKIPGTRTLKINDSLFLWFVLQARSVNDIEKMPSKVQFSITNSKSEIKRRLDEILKSREKSEFPITYVNDYPSEQHVSNFEFFVNLGNPNQVNSISPYIPAPTTHPSSGRSAISTTHSVFIPGFTGTIEVRVSKSLGANNYPWTIRSGTDLK